MANPLSVSNGIGEGMGPDGYWPSALVELVGPSGHVAPVRGSGTFCQRDPNTLVTSLAFGCRLPRAYDTYPTSNADEPPATAPPTDQNLGFDICTAMAQSRSRSCFVWYCAYPRKALSCKSCRSTVSQSVEFTGWRACTLGRYTSVLGRIYFFKSMQGARLVVTSVRT